MDGQLKGGFAPRADKGGDICRYIGGEGRADLDAAKSRARGGSGSDAITHVGDVAQAGREAVGESARTSSLTLRAYPSPVRQTQVESPLAVAATRSMLGEIRY